MLSIPHNRLNVQVGSGFASTIGHIPENVSTPTPSGLSHIQRTAFELYDMGLNVFPQPIGKKGGLPWKSLQFTRLERDDRRYGLKTLFVGSSNLAIMCGRTSRNLFVIDCETQDALQYHMEQLRQRRIPLWVVRTARGGHIYLRAKDGEVHNVSSGILPDAEIKGQGGYVLGPPSVHPSGALYEWLHREGQEIPSIHSSQIDWLRDNGGSWVPLTVTASGMYTPGQWKQPRPKRTKLSRRTQDYLNTGHTLPEGSRNNRLFAAACDLAGNGYTQSETLKHVLPIATSSGLPEREARATIASAYSQQRSPSRPQENSESDENSSWWTMLLWVTNHRWEGRVGSSERVLMLALIERARVSSNENGVFRGSIRELAELAHMGSGTVQRRLKSLRNKEIIFHCGSDQSSNASLWKFNERILKETQLQMDTLALAPHWLRYSVSVFNSELAERGAMGRSVLYVFSYLALFGGCWMPSALAEALDISVNQANYALRKLSRLGFVVRESEGWCLTVTDFAQAEAILVPDDGQYKPSQRRRRRFQRERARFAGRLLHNARLHREGRAYYEAISAQHALDIELATLLDDPLISLGLELGGVLRLSDGRTLALEPM